LETASISLNYEKIHKYLGYSTILLVGMAAITSSNESLHYASAYTATGTALATCFTGYYEYRDRFDLDEGLFADDNLHIILGTLGTLGVATAIAIADSGEEKSHAGIGITGGTSMLISVIVIKW
jgi:ammonia channel protein AmtB